MYRPVEAVEVRIWGALVTAYLQREGVRASDITHA